MSPKPTISREVILDAAWDLVQSEGSANLNARALAARLGCSTMPIYSAVGSMAALDALLRQRVAEALGMWQKRSWGPNKMLDMAVGYVMFAREEPRLFKYLFSASIQGAESAEAKPEGDESDASDARDVRDVPVDLSRFLDMPEAKSVLASSPAYNSFIAGMARDTQNSFAFRSWVFIHGLANLVSEGIVNLPPEELIAHVEAAGSAFYMYHTQTGGSK